MHGWDSNAGSMSKIADKLVEKERYVIAINLPGHAFSKKSATNLLECKEAFKALLNEVNPTESFSVISHSFGSGVTAYALSETNYKVNNLIFLTNPNRVEHIFEDFKKMILILGQFKKLLLNLIVKSMSGRTTLRLHKQMIWCFSGPRLILNICVE